MAGVTKDPPPDAAESNAGDDFHLLWGARRALRLLDPARELSSICVEGPDPKEATLVDPEGDQLLGIDITEYFGGDSFLKASQIVHCQLKYSTRHPDRNWTASRLTQGKNKNGKGSVVHRLAQVFGAYLRKYGRLELLAKMRLCLVTNRPVDVTVLNALLSAKELIAAAASPLKFSTLGLEIKPLAELTKLKNGAALDDADFVDFLRVLDLSRSGLDARLEQELAIVRQLGAFGFFDASKQYGALKNLMHRKMMPEGKRNPIITADDIAAAMGIADRVALFPSPARFEHLDHQIDRQQMPGITNAVINANDRPVLIHGAAGMGKSTIARRIEGTLPRGSVVILFDCYGAGSYLDPAETRHGHSRAITQIANELASRVGSPLLLNRELTNQDLLRELIKRMGFTALIVTNDAPTALVVVVIDASDNSVAAARQRQESSFIHDLVRCKIPIGCRLVVTARTHRRGELNLPADFVDMELLPFDKNESRENLTRAFPMASPVQGDEFHSLSNAIPRVQGYAIKGGRGELERVFDALRPDGKTVEHLIDQQLNEAALRCGSYELVASICRAMLALPRPIPISYVSSLTQCSREAVRDICIDLHEGLIVDGDAVSFRDEDFETHLRARHSPDPSTYIALADLLAAKAEADSYASEHLADALALAHRHAQIIELVLTKKQPRAIADPVVRQEVFARRSRLALEAALRVDDRISLLKLIFVVAEACKADQAVERLLLDNSDLACRYGDPKTVQRLYLSERNHRIPWHGPNHLLCAANFSRNADTLSRAREHLDAARAWVSHWSSLPDSEQQEWTISVDDIANGAEAVLRLKGAITAQEWITKWRPATVVVAAARKMIRVVFAAHGRGAIKLLDVSRLRADGQTLAAEASMDIGLLPPADIVFAACEFWRKHFGRRRGIAAEMRRAGMRLCEAAAAHGLDPIVVRDVIGCFLPALPNHRLSLLSDESAEYWDVCLRGRALLKSLGGDSLRPDDPSLLPEELRGPEPAEIDTRTRRNREEEIEKAKYFLGLLVPVYDLRAQQLSGRKQDETIIADLEKLASRVSDWDWTARRYEIDGVRGDRLRIVTLADVSVRVGSRISQTFAAVCGTSDGKRSDSLSLELAETATHFDLLHSAAVGLLEAIHKRMLLAPSPASQQIETLVSCSRIAGGIDPRLGQHYFELAVEAASEIDEEAFSLLTCLSTIAQHRRPDGFANDRTNAQAFATVIEACHWRLEGWDHFPWSECIRGLVSLSPGVAAAAIGRWEQRGILQMSDYITEFTSECLARRFLSAEAAIAFSLLAPLGSEAAMTVALEGISQVEGKPSVTQNAVRMVCDHARRIAPLSARHHLGKQILNWIGRRPESELEEVKDIERMITLLDAADELPQCPPEQAPSKAAGRTTIGEEADVNLNGLLRDRTFSSAPAIEAALRALLEQTEKANPRGWGRGPVIRQLLERIREATRVNEYVSQLNALMEVDPTLLDIDDLLAALQDRTTNWCYHPHVRDWRGKLPEMIAQRRFGEFLFGGGLAEFRLDAVQGASGIAKHDIVKCLMVELPYHVRSVGAQAAYDFARLIAPTLNENETAAVATWQLGQLAASLDREGLAVWGLRDAKLPGSGDDLESAILWSMFGHPDRRRRWVAIHSARRLAHLGRAGVLTGLVERSKETACAFVAPKTTFYWLAAKQSLLALLDRLASELPSQVRPFSRVLEIEILEPDPPHALIMHFAKRAALKLGARKDNPYSAKTLQRIKAALVPTVKATSKKTRRRTHATHGGYRAARSERFHFDSTDTLPYWYEPLGRKFDFTGDVFCQAAEKWICDRWGFKGDVWQNDPTRNRRESSRDWALRSNRHGSHPTVEGLHTYLELQAMFCVAAELVRDRPILPPQWDEDGDEWQDWIRRWDLMSGDGWLSDRRQSTPFERQLWTDQREYRQERLLPPCDEDFARALGLHQSHFSDYFVADGNWTRYYNSGREKFEVDTALVSLTSADALLHALAGCDDPYDYRIPNEGDELEFSETIGDVDFILSGWVARQDSDAEGFDSDDPLLNELPKSLALPGKHLVRNMRLVFSPDQTKSYRGKDDENPFSVFEHWNDCERREERYGFATKGQRLWMRWTDVKAFLPSGGWAVIARCTIARSTRNSTNDEDEDVTKTKLYLLHADGNVQAISGRDRARKPSR